MSQAKGLQLQAIANLIPVAAGGMIELSRNEYGPLSLGSRHTIHARNHELGLSVKLVIEVTAPDPHGSAKPSCDISEERMEKVKS